MRKRLREVVGTRRAQRAELAMKALPRYDEIWEEAMAVERRLHEDAVDLAGASLAFTDESAASFAAAADE